MSILPRSARVRALLASLPFLALGCSACPDEPLGPGTYECPVIVVDDYEAQAAPGGEVRTIILDRRELLGTLAPGQRILVDASNTPLPTTVSPGALDRVQTFVTASAQIPASATAGRYEQTLDLTWFGFSGRCEVDQPSVTYEIEVVIPQSFTASAAPTALAMLQGDSASTTLTITRLGGFGSIVTATAAGLPQGVTTSGGVISEAASSAAMTFIASDDAAVGTDTVTLTLAGGNVPSQTLPIVLTVNARPGFEFVLEPDSQLVYQGETGAPVEVIVTRTGGFNGELGLSIDGLPRNVTPTFVAPGPGSNGSITFTASPDTAQGTYELAVTANGAQVGSKTRTFTLTVLPPPTLYLEFNPFVTTGPGTSVNVPVGIQRQGWEGEVTVTVTRASDGISATVTPTSTTGDALNIELQIGSVAAGAYEVELLATGATGLTTTSVIFITVTDPDSASPAQDAAGAVAGIGDGIGSSRRVAREPNNQASR